MSAKALVGRETVDGLKDLPQLSTLVGIGHISIYTPQRVSVIIYSDSDTDSHVIPFIVNA